MREESARTVADAKARAPGRTGRLRASIHAREDRGTGRAGFSLVSDHPASAIREFGGTILPRTKEYLAIPLRGQTAWPRHVGRHIVIRSRAGRLLLFDRRPRDGGTAQYLLRRSVYVRPQPYMGPAATNARRRIRRKLAGETITNRPG